MWKFFTSRRHLCSFFFCVCVLSENFIDESDLYESRQVWKDESRNIETHFLFIDLYNCLNNNFSQVSSVERGVEIEISEFSSKSGAFEFSTPYLVLKMQPTFTLMFSSLLKTPAETTFGKHKCDEGNFQCLTLKKFAAASPWQRCQFKSYHADVSLFSSFFKARKLIFSSSLAEEICALVPTHALYNQSLK